MGANFRLRLKKSPRLPHVQSTVEPGLTHKATGPRVRVGQGFGDFLGLLGEGHSTSQKKCRGGGLTPRRSSFSQTMEPSRSLDISTVDKARLSGCLTHIHIVGLHQTYTENTFKKYVIKMVYTEIIHTKRY